MDQIALPFRIALVAVVVIGGLWMTVLKPKAGSEDTPATAPGVTGLTTATDKASAAVATANAAGAKAAGTGATTTATPATPAAPAARGATAATTTAPAPKAAPVRGVAAGDPSAPILRAVDQGKVAVVLFAGRRSTDDRAVARAFRRLGTTGGAVRKSRIPVADVGRYEALTRGVQVTQTPTVLIVDPFRRAQVVTGLTTLAELRQRVSDAVAAAKPVRGLSVARDAAVRRAGTTCGGSAQCETFFTQANDVCVATGRAAIVATAAAPAPAAVPQAIQQAVDAGAAQLAALKAPAAQAPAQERAVGLLKTESAALVKGTALVAKAADAKGALVRATSRVDRSAAVRRGNAELRRLGFAACA